MVGLIPEIACLAFALVGHVFGGLLGSAELQLGADRERAGAVIAERLVERILDALRLDLTEPREVLQLLRRGTRNCSEALQCVEGD